MRKLKTMLVAFAALFCVSATAGNVGLIPHPVKMTINSGSFKLADGVVIESTSASSATASYLQAELAKNYSVKAKVSSPKSSNTGAKITFKEDANLAKEAYKLSVKGSVVEITASEGAGWFYGVQSMIQLFDIADNGSITIPQVAIEDEPAFAWRAMMLDEARYFKGMDVVKQLLDEMAFLKMNVFHWHLVDDQGWRVEIKKYPLLTEVGAKRKSTQVGALHWKSNVQSGEPHEGFYTQKDVKEIIAYAAERHITIVPEIEMPGHSSAAIAAYPWLGASGKPIDVPVRFGVGDDVYDVSKPEVYQFLTDVLDEIIALFPSEVIHIGGDELKYFHWERSEDIMNYMKELNLEAFSDLHVHFTNKISNYITSKGRKMMGWNEILGHNVHHYQADYQEATTELAAGSVIHFWDGDPKIAKQAAEKNFEVVNSHCYFTYLDYSYDRIPLSKAYGFSPIPDDLEEEYHDKIIGVGCQMWSEWIPTVGEMHYQVFPRVAAYAEVGWSTPESKDLERFKAQLPTLQSRWDERGIYYAPDSDVEPVKE